MKTWKPDKQWSAQRGLNPTRTVAASFGVMIALGTLLLLHDSHGFILSFIESNDTCYNSYNCSN